MSSMFTEVAPEPAPKKRGPKGRKPEAPLVYSIQQISELLSCSRELVYRMLHLGKLNATKIGARTFITRASIDRLIQP